MVQDCSDYSEILILILKMFFFFFNLSVLLNGAIQGGPQKCLYFFFGNNFYKNKETFKVFSLQLLEVYRILLLETALKSIIFYYFFSVINTMFVPCTALLYGRTSASRTLKLFTILLSISC